MRLALPLLIAAMFGCTPQPQENSSSLVGAAVQSTHERAKDYILAAAAEIPDADYAYRPTDAVRTVAEQLGHIADAQNQFCIAAGGELAPGQAQIEKRIVDKAGLTAALQTSFAACEPLFAEADTALLRQVTPGSSDPSTRLSLLVLNASHNFEHYGNLVTYMRMRGLVPPSSQP